MINIDIYNGPGYTEYCSKAKKLRQIWSDEPDSIVGTLLNDKIETYRKGQQQMRKSAKLDSELPF